VNVLAWYDSLTQNDPYVVGTTIFTAGAISAELGWTQFDLHEAMVPLTNYVMKHRK
jgi:hypothetical protein